MADLTTINTKLSNQKKSNRRKWLRIDEPALVEILLTEREEDYVRALVKNYDIVWMFRDTEATRLNIYAYEHEQFERSKELLRKTLKRIP